MKLKNFLALMAVAFLATGFTSCDDDDETVGTTSSTDDFYGVATIYTPEFMGQPATTSFDSTFVTHITKQSDGKYTVVLPESSLTGETAEDKGMGMPTISIKDLDFTKASNGVLTYQAKSLTIAVMANKNAVISNFNVEINPATKKANVAYGIQFGNMPFSIQYDFKTLLKNDFVVGTFMGVNNQLGVKPAKMPEETSADSMNVASIELQSNGKYTLVLPEKDKSVRGMELPTNIKLSDIDIEGKGNTFTFSIEEVTVQTPQMPILLKGVKGSIKGNEFKLTYDLKPGAMPAYILYSYEGGKIK